MSYFLGTTWRWVLMLVVILLLGWFWVSWRGGSFPFGASWQKQPTTQDTINSLTAKEVPAATTTLKELTPPTGAKASTASSAIVTASSSDTNSILDSLTPKK